MAAFHLQLVWQGLYIYCQLPLDPRGWPLICFFFKGRFCVDISPPFGLRWAASHCQDATNLVSRELRRWDHSLLNYIDDFGVVAPSKPEVDSHVAQLQGLLETLGLQEAHHKVSLPHSQVLVCMAGVSV